MALISIKRNVDLQPGLNAPAVFNCSQSDKGTTIMLGLMNGGNDYTVPSGVTITIRGSRSNGAVFTPVSATSSGSTVSFTLTEEMTDTAGPTLCEAVLEQGNNVLGTANFIINVEASPMGADVPPVFTDAAWAWMLGKLTTETVPALGDDVISSIQGKVNKSQGSTNAKKFLRVNTSGNVSLESTDKTLLVADQIADAKETGDQIRALDAEIDGVATTLGGSISTLNGITTDLQSSKLNKSQGTSNAGKTMVVDSSGNIVPGDALALKANESTIAPEFSTSASYTAGSYVLKNGVLYKFTTAHSGVWTGTDAEVVTVGEEVEDLSESVDSLKSAFDEKVNSRYGSAFSPNLILSDTSMTMGYIGKTGAIASSSSMAYTDFIPVESGYILRAYYTKQGTFTTKGLRFVCCYDQSKTPVSSAGTNTTVSTFTVPEGIAFVRVTFDGVAETGIQATSNYMISVNCVPTEYTAYTPLKANIAEDFLTQESEAFLAGLMENGISSKNITNKYGCALPQTKIFQTIGLPEKWYNDSIITPPTSNIIVSAGSQYTSRSNDGISFLNTTALTSSNGYNWWLYDVFYALIKSGTGNAGLGWARRFIAENLSDCSLLAIGDSTVDHDTLTATLLSHFTEQGHTLTLLGTLGDGSGTNKNEGRAGWSAQDYLTNRQYQGVTNPFYNPTAQTFDFAYYMSNQGYTGVDFVVIQLGINDLYNYDDTKIIPTWDAISAIIDSILAYNNGIKIILNLPTTPNSDQSQLNASEFLYRNRVIRYNEYAMAQSLAKYGTTKVRCSYCHLILDSHTEIRDNVHPTTEGYQKMALEVVNQINCWQNGV